MKRRIISILILLIGGQHLLHAQINKFQWLDIELSNYQYPSCLQFEIEQIKTRN